jgi:hypothetical protein
MGSIAFAPVLRIKPNSLIVAGTLPDSYFCKRAPSRSELGPVLVDRGISAKPLPDGGLMTAPFRTHGRAAAFRLRQLLIQEFELSTRLFHMVG